MNFTTKLIKPFGIFALLLVALLPGMCQLQHGGKPFDVSSGIKAADVLYVLPPPDPFEIESAILRNRAGDHKAITYALERPLDLSPDSHGSWVDYKDYRVWRVHIISPGAQSLGVIFNPYKLKPGAHLFIYDVGRKSVKGSYNSENNKSSGLFAVGHIPGEEVIIELQVPLNQDDFGELKISSVSHAFLPFGADEVNKCPGDFGCSEYCEIDVNCDEGDNWKRLNRSVLRIQTPTQYCTGVLINNTAYDEKPYVLTVEHCINNSSSAASAILLFNYESPECSGEDGSRNWSISGATLKAAGDSIDFSLIELSVTPPDSFNAYYAGWDLTENPESGVTTIHHPMGDVKKISFDFDYVSTPQSTEDIKAADLLDYHYFSLWWVHQWDLGTTEPGSSGAPLFNRDKRVIGLLSGGLARCGIGVNVNDYYTKLNVAWNFYGENGPNLKEWLDPINSGKIAIDGYNPVTNRIQPLFRKGNLTLYPNPAKNRIYLSGPISLEEPLKYSIFDLTGRLILTGKKKLDTPFEVILPEVPPGMYIIKVSGYKIDESIRFVIE